jgi:hypothetical protein
VYKSVKLKIKRGPIKNGCKLTTDAKEKGVEQMGTKQGLGVQRVFNMPMRQTAAIWSNFYGDL